MFTVTLKLANPPTEGTGWFFLYGPVTPFEEHVSEWKLSDSAAVADLITVQMDEATRYIRVDVLAPPMGRTVYVFEITTPFVFKDKTTYIWDCSTNSLSPEVPEEPPVDIFADIIAFVLSVSDFFKGLHDNVPDLAWLTDWIKTPLLFIYETIFKLIKPITQFGYLVNDVADKVSNILSSVDIIKLLKTWLQYAEDAWAWVNDAPSKVWGLTTEWWRSTNNPIRAAIDGIIQLAKDLVAGVQKELTEVHTAWDDFWTITYPTLISAKDANDLMDTKVKETKPFWEGWSDVKDNVVKLISAPFDWLLERFTDWFLGKEK